MEELRKILEFYIVEPDVMLKWFDPELTLKTMIGDLLLQDLFTFIMVIVIFLTLIILSLPLLFVPKIKVPIKRKLRKLR